MMSIKRFNAWLFRMLDGLLDRKYAGLKLIGVCRGREREDAASPG